MESMGLVVVVAAAAAFAAIVWFSISRERASSRAREQRAMERGWTYARGGRGGRLYAVQGTEGGAQWTLAVYRGGKNKSGRTTWAMPDTPLSGGAVFVGSKALAAILKNPLGNRVARWAAQMAAPSDGVSGAWSKLLEGHQQIETGDPAFDGSYAVLATDAGQARRLVNADTCKALLEWEEAHRVGRYAKGRLTLAWWDGGLMLAWEGSGVQSPDAMTAFADLGIRVAAGLRQGW